jgi:branched-chain amino acid transport system substrate-binding protein
LILLSRRKGQIELSAASLGRTVLVIVLLSCAVVAQQQHEPYRGVEKRPLAFNGPGREDPEPSGLTSVSLGLFGPQGTSESQQEQIWQGANLAIERANQAGGYRGLPFRLVSVWTENPWAGGAAKLIRSVYDDNLWGIIGGVDSATTHLAEQVVAKAQLVLINPAATDRSIHAANVPWMFSCVPGDNVLAPLISNELKTRKLPFALVSSTEHDARSFTKELNQAFKHDRLSPVAHFEFDTQSPRIDVVKSVLGTRSGAIVVIANADQTRDFILTIRGAGYNKLIVAGPWLARTGALPDIVNVVLPQLGDIQIDFRDEFARRYGHQPDYAAAHSYDAANLLITSIRKAGLNRARILDGMRAQSPYKGITGLIEWDALGQNRRDPQLVDSSLIPR